MATTTKKAERRILEMPPYRTLKVFAFDPTKGHSLGNHMKLDVRYEPLKPGPVGKYLAVVDYDGSNKCYYQPVDLDDPAILLRNGLDPSESDPQFHQQMVYAVASETIKRFERALGRSIRWSFAKWDKKESDGRLLYIFPHAMQEANAYYSRDMRGIVFGYFQSSATDAGDNLPGQTICTCLSHDIVAHETTHALVDSQRDYFLEATSFDTPAFHEAFADIVALFQHFSYKEALLEMVQRTGGLIFRNTLNPQAGPGDGGGAVISAQLSPDNPLVGLAKQFGDALGMRGALRSALGTPPNTKALQGVFEPHLRGSILVAAVFDAFFSIYIKRTADLMRIARAGGLQQSSGELHPDIASRLVDAATKTADHFFNICVRALDYCPPVDILFGDFLRAMITADYDLVPNDTVGYRAALVDAFRSRGIVPEGVVSYSEESLIWCPPEVLRKADLPRCEGLQFDVLRRSEAEHRKQQQRNAQVLHKFAVSNAALLGLSAKEPIQAKTFHQVHRIGPDGQLKFGVVAELTQKREVLRVPGERTSKIIFRGGTTLVLDRNGDVLYAIQKSIGSPEENDKNTRLIRQLDYLEQAQAMMAFAAYADPRELNKTTMNFELIHRGY
jgi:hypothetical protein